VLSANCNCSAAGTDTAASNIGNDVMGDDELANVLHGAVDVSQLANAAAVKVELPDELLHV